MTIRKTSLLLATTSAAALTVFAFSVIDSRPANADCEGAPAGPTQNLAGYEGLNVADTITCDADVPDGGGTVNGNGGGDTITIDGSSMAAINGNDGGDTIIFNSGDVETDISGNDGNDFITLNDGVVEGGILGNNDDDVIALNGGTIGDDPGANNVNGGNGNDTITLNGTFIENDIVGAADDDVIMLISGRVEDVFGSSGNDTITADGANIIEDIGGGTGNDRIIVNADDFLNVDAGEGNDTIEMNGGGVDNLLGDDGNDTILMTSGQVDEDVEGNNDNDTILVTGGVVGDGDTEDDILGGNGNDSILLMDAEVTGDIEGGNDEDTITVMSGTVGDEVRGGAQNDTITLNGGLVIDDIEGDDGDDVIDLFAGKVGNGTTASNVQGEDGNDTITLAGAFVEDDITGGNNDDVIDLLSGTVGVDGTDEVRGDDGNDQITLAGAFLVDDILGGTGNDMIEIASGTARVAQGNEDEDSITMNGGTVLAITGDNFSDDPDGQGQNDRIEVVGGDIGLDIWGQGGDDTIIQDGADIVGDIQGGLDNDLITLLDGTVTNVWGDAFDGVSQAGDGDDLIFLGTALSSGTAEVLGNIVSGAGNDTVNLFGGTVGGNVLAGSGEDALFVSGSDALIIGSVIGESGNDFIQMNAGTVGGALFGGSGDDEVFLDGGSVGGDVDGESGNDLVELAGGVIGGDALGGSGDDIGGVLFDFDFDDLSGGAGMFAGDQNTGDGTLGDDELFFSFWEGEVNADRLPEWERVEIGLFSEVTFTGGTLQTNGNGDIEVLVGATSSLLLNNNVPGGGNTTIVGNLLNENLIDMSTADPDPDNVLTVTGDYTAASALKLDTFLNDGKPTISDQLIIGGSASGETEITIVPDGPGGLTGFGPEDGILVVATSDSTDDAFTLGNFDLTAGIFEYFLANPEGQPPGQDNWYLQSDYLDQIYVYENLPGAMQTIGSALTGQLVERVGVRSAVPSSLPDADGNPVRGGAPVDTALWARAVGLSLESDGDIDSTTNGSFDQTIGFIQGGGEVVVSQSQSGRLLIGALGHWGTSSLDADNSRGADAGSANFDFYGGGLTATWYGTSGLYLDAVAQYTAYDIDISTATRWPSQSTDGWGVSVSGEAGYRIPIGATAALVPQGQLTWQTLDFDDFTDPDGVRVSYEDDDSLVGRLGVAFENNAAIGSSLATGYVEANVMYEFLGDNSVNTFTPEGGNIALNQQTREAWVEVGFGGTIAVAEGVSLYGEVDYALPFDGGVRGVQAVGGIRVNLNPPPVPPPPAPVIAPVAETAFIVFFDWDRADLTSEANLVLDDVVVVANQTGYASIRLDGYTDLSGSAAYNLGLSERRANSVANALIARGIAPDEIVIRAFGEENPLVPTPDGVREPQNRRVEIFLG